jgi:two-component system chemotaxis sensor kinase CheA
VEEQARSWSVVVLEAGGIGRAAVGVERVLGMRRGVSKPLPASIPPLPLVLGASFDAQGEPLLVLDPVGLVRLVRGGTTSATPEVRVARRQRVLVVDDSITTRMLEKSILESAGYEVELAASGEEGMEKVFQGDFSLALVDVEMPGISGLEFTRRMKQVPTLQAMPVIMVSSLGSEQDRRWGYEAGAAAYIVKGEFDQRGFLETVARLAGRPGTRMGDE